MNAAERSEQAHDPIKPLFWMASSKDDLRKLPEEVKDVMGFALFQAQLGRRHVSAKPLRGFGGAGVLEIVEDHRGNTFRGVYTVKFAGAVYVLDVFQKKSKKGAKTPPRDMDRIKNRMKAAEQHYQNWQLSQAREDQE